MEKSKSIFASKAERNAFSLIQSCIPEGFALYPNIPLSQIISAEKGELPETDWDFYLKSSVDFVLTDRSAQPILAIEFDGLAGGFSCGQEYQAPQASNRPVRSTKLNFKLNLCSRVSFPLYIISYEEIARLKQDDALTIVHGIVAQHLVRMAVKQKITHWDSNSRGIGKSFEEMLWDLAAVETALQHKYDPFKQGMETLWNEFSSMNLSYRLQPVSVPNPFEVLRTGKPFDKVGAHFTAYGELLVPVELTVWVRNFAGEALGASLSAEVPIHNGVNPLRIAENIAEYLGMRKAIEVNGGVKRGYTTGPSDRPVP
jgi:hypothetical protein